MFYSPMLRYKTFKKSLNISSRCTFILDNLQIILFPALAYYMFTFKISPLFSFKRPYNTERKGNLTLLLQKLLTFKLFKKLSCIKVTKYLINNFFV